MNFKTLALFYILFTMPFIVTALQGLTGFPELTMADIPGAPKLGKPMLVTGTISEVVSQGHGLAAPAFYDWDNDELEDLLIGEFGSGVEQGRYVGNFVRVYRNIGTKERPEFEGKFNYASPPFQYKVQAHGTPYSVDQFCCIGFTPQFVDLNNDGHLDMVTGSYQGEVFWFRKTEEGFLPGEPLLQHGNPRDPDNAAFQKNQFYWSFSSASFGDFTGDGLQDLIVGGNSLRISKNIGTADMPAFGVRELLLDVEGNPLKVYEYLPEELAEKKKLEELSRGILPVPVAGADHISPYVVDWDQDGTLDLLVTNAYLHRGLVAVIFFKGVKASGQHRFQKGVPLFTAAGGKKAFPGSNPKVFVTDWNNDGISDLLIGASVATVKGEFNDQLSWDWEKTFALSGAGKDPSLMASLSDKQLENYKKQAKLPPGITIEDYLTIRHKGYVYVMLGSKAEPAPQQTNKSKTKRK